MLVQTAYAYFNKSMKIVISQTHVMVDNITKKEKKTKQNKTKNKKKTKQNKTKNNPTTRTF